MRRTFAAIAVATLAFCGGCETVAAPESRPADEAPERIVVALPPERSTSALADPSDKNAHEDEVSAVAAEMENDLARGDYERAMRAGDDLVRRGLTPEARRRIEPLRSAAEGKLLQTLFIDGIILLDRDRRAVGEPLTGELVLINLSGEELRIRHEDPDAGGRGSKTAIRFEVERLEFGADGTTIDDQLKWTAEPGRDIVVAAGGRATFPLEIETLGENPGSVGLRIYTIKAVLFPAGMTTGGRKLSGAIQFAPRTAQVFPRNYEHLATDPVGRLAEAIEKRSPVHVPLAAALVSPSDRGRATEIVQRALADPSLRDAATLAAVCVAARVLTGKALPAVPETWRDYFASSAAPR